MKPRGNGKIDCWLFSKVNYLSSWSRNYWRLNPIVSVASLDRGKLAKGKCLARKMRDEIRVYLVVLRVINFLF